MLSWEIINEAIDNLFVTDKEHRLRIADDVFTILQKSYAPIGGLKGSGFNSPQEMVDKIPFWKVLRRGADIKAVVMYKDKNGRKRVAIGSDGSPDAKKFLASALAQDARGRAYSEISGPSLKFHKRVLGDEIDNLTIPVEQVSEILPQYEIHPLDDYEYQREINGELITKRMIGNPGNRIVPK